MTSREQVAAARAVQRETGPTFHVATRLLPERVRHPTYVLYAFFRRADEVVDGPEPAPPTEQRRRLGDLRDAVLGRTPTDDPVLSAVDTLRERHEIPDREFDAFLDAMAADIDHDGYRTRADQREYLRGSAVAVANMMLAVMDPDDPAVARGPAAALGEAFQLTNFLRDVGEDLRDLDRVYLPESILERHGVDPDALAPDALAPDAASPGFVAAMAEETRRTEALYRRGVAGIGTLPRDCQLPVLVSAVLYAEHHRQLRARGYDTLSATPSHGLREYARCLALTALHWYRSGDPETVFYRVSPIDREPTVEDPWGEDRIEEPRSAAGTTDPATESPGGERAPAAAAGGRRVRRSRGRQLAAAVLSRLPGVN